MIVDDRPDLDRLANLQRLVTAMVKTRLRRVSESRVDAVARLQRLEQAAWTAGADRQTLQVITSGRRLLGDTIDLTPKALRRKPGRTRLANPVHL